MSHSPCLPPSLAHMKEVFVSHRGALHPRSLLQAAEQSVADSSGMRQQAGRQCSWFWKEDVAVLLLTSVAWIVLSCASKGFCSIICAHFIASFCGGVCVCVCAHLPQDPLLLTFALHRFFFLFVFLCVYSTIYTWCRDWCIFECINLWNCSYASLRFHPSPPLLWHRCCKNAPVVLLLRLLQML